MPAASAVDCSFHLLKDCVALEPLVGANGYELCPAGDLLNLRHREAQSREAAANADLNEAADFTSRMEQFEHFKAAVAERQNLMSMQISHVKDCFICSMAFGLTPEVAVKSEQTSFTQFVARFSRTDWLYKMKLVLQRI